MSKLASDERTKWGYPLVCSVPICLVAGTVQSCKSKVHTQSLRYQHDLRIPLGRAQTPSCHTLRYDTFFFLRLTSSS